METELKTETKLPLTVAAPVIIDATTKEGVQPFLDFVRSLEEHNNEEIAQEESRRLQPYFQAMGTYLTNMRGKLDQARKQASEGLTTRGALSGIFNAMATKTHNTMISDVVILPDNIYNTGPASHLFRGKYEFNTGYSYDDYSFNFGFFQVFEGGLQKKALSSTTFPTFRIDHRMMNAVPADQLTPVLHGLQAVMTFVNHDMLHHLTSPIINPSTVAKIGGDNSKMMSDWDKNIPSADKGEAYEHWAQIGHERALLEGSSAETIDDIRGKLDLYFQELKKLDGTTQELQDGNSEQPTAHEVVDYFGMLMAHALTRVFPLNHPIIIRCLQQLEKTDPDSGKALEDCYQMMKSTFPAGAWMDKTQQELRTLMLNDIRTVAGYKKGYNPIADIVESYQESSHPLLPKKDQDVGYIHLKLLQLARLAQHDVRPHIPKPAEKSIADIRKVADKLTLDMIIAAAKTTNYQPM